GSVMHGNDEDTDIKHFGGLRRAMPITFWTTLAAWAAIIGVPLTSGFYSKDQVLAALFEHGGVGRLAWAVGVLTAALTAFYMSRDVFLTFFGERRWPAGRHSDQSPPPRRPPARARGPPPPRAPAGHDRAPDRARRPGPGGRGRPHHLHRRGRPLPELPGAGAGRARGARGAGDGGLAVGGGHPHGRGRGAGRLAAVHPPVRLAGSGPPPRPGLGGPGPP